MLGEAIPVSLGLGLSSLFLTFVLGVAIGTLQAARRGTVVDPALKARVIEEGLAVYLADNRDAWALAADGTWQRVVPRRGARRRSAQTQLLERLRKPSQDDS